MYRFQTSRNSTASNKRLKNFNTAVVRTQGARTEPGHRERSGTFSVKVMSQVAEVTKSTQPLKLSCSLFTYKVISNCSIVVSVILW